MLRYKIFAFIYLFCYPQITAALSDKRRDNVLAAFHRTNRMYNGTRQFFDLAQKDLWTATFHADFVVGVNHFNILTIEKTC